MTSTMTIFSYPALTRRHSSGEELSRLLTHAADTASSFLAGPQENTAGPTYSPHRTFKSRSSFDGNGRDISLTAEREVRDDVTEKTAECSLSSSWTIEEEDEGYGSILTSSSSISSSIVILPEPSYQPSFSAYEDSHKIMFVQATPGEWWDRSSCTNSILDQEYDGDEEEEDDEDNERFYNIFKSRPLSPPTIMGAEELRSSPNHQDACCIMQHLSIPSALFHTLDEDEDDDDLTLGEI